MFEKVKGDAGVGGSIKLKTQTKWWDFVDIPADNWALGVMSVKSNWMGDQTTLTNVKNL